MSADIRTMLSGSHLTLPVSNGRCDLGTWQGVYLWEHRTAGHRRRLVVTVSASRSTRESRLTPLIIYLILPTPSRCDRSMRLTRIN